MERNGLSNFDGQSPKEHSCEIISNLSTDLAEVGKKHISIYSPGGHFVQRSGIL